MGTGKFERSMDIEVDRSRERRSRQSAITDSRSLIQFGSSLDSISARQMTQAIEEGCEWVDAGEW
jgi:hypothetical protein